MFLFPSSFPSYVWHLFSSQLGPQTLCTLGRDEDGAESITLRVLLFFMVERPPQILPGFPLKVAGTGALGFFGHKPMHGSAATHSHLMWQKLCALQQAACCQFPSDWGWIYLPSIRAHTAWTSLVQNYNSILCKCVCITFSMP